MIRLWPGETLSFDRTSYQRNSMAFEILTELFGYWRGQQVSMFWELGIHKFPETILKLPLLAEIFVSQASDGGGSLEPQIREDIPCFVSIDMLGVLRALKN